MSTSALPGRTGYNWAISASNTDTVQSSIPTPSDTEVRTYYLW